MAHHPSAGHGSPDDEYLETPPGSIYEHTDADTRPLVRFLFGCLISAVVIHFGLAGAYQLMVNIGIGRETSERQYPMSEGQEHPLPPVPRLQQFPGNERFEFQTEERRLLTSYAWSNKEAGIVRIPVAEAMRLTLERGLPSRPAAEASGETPEGMMPADSSSGRTFERRRQ
jgi:hypothetical protein